MSYYSQGLAALRVALDDEHTAVTSETLCAVMLLVYCQVPARLKTCAERRTYTFCQARIDDQFTFFSSPHGKGLAHLLRRRGFPSGINRFENYLFRVLTSTLLLQSFANPDVSLCADEYDLMDEAFVNAAKGLGNPDIRHWRLMGRISRLMARSRDISASGLTDHTVAVEAQNLCHSMDAILAEMRSSHQTPTNQSDTAPPGTIIHAIRQRGFGVALATKAILLCACRTLLLDQSALQADIAHLCQEALGIIEDARIYRPLGAVWTVHTLICLWCVVRDASLKAKVELALLDYQRDALCSTFQLPLDQLTLLQQRLSLQN